MHRINANNRYQRFNNIGHQNKPKFGFVQNQFDDRVHAKRLARKLEKQKQKEVEERIKEDELLNTPIYFYDNKKLITKFDRIFNERKREFQLKVKAWFMIFILVGMVLSSVSILESTHIETFSPYVYTKNTRISPLIYFDTECRMGAN